MIYLGTEFQQGMFVNSMSAEATWKALRRCWIIVYARAPDILQTDSGSNFTAEELREAVDELGVVIKTVPTESYNRIGRFERSHAVLRAI